MRGGKQQRNPRAITFLAASVLTLSAAHARCPGDCRAVNQVTARDLLVVAAIVLGVLPPSRCPAADISNDGHVTVDELLSAVHAALNGCPTPSTPVPTATETPTDPPTATPTVNLPPRIPMHDVYSAYPGHPIRLPVAPVDPEGGRVRCDASDLPEGAQLGDRGVFEWTPGNDQLGPLSVKIQCFDDAQPPAQSDGRLFFKVHPPDLCVEPICIPEQGCDVPLPPVDEPCCRAVPSLRVAEPEAPCPAGRVLLVGRNSTGFGALQNCDLLRIRNMAQVGATALLHFKARCLDADQPVLVHARMETAGRGVVFDLEKSIHLRVQEDGFARRRFVDFPIDNPPYFDLQDAEANLHVVVRDAAGNQVARSLRVKLTFTPIPDLPDPTVPPALAPTPSS